MGRWLAFIQGLFQGIQHKVFLHTTTDPPANYAPGLQVRSEGHIQPARPSADLVKSTPTARWVGWLLTSTLSLRQLAIHGDCWSSRLTEIIH